MQSSFQALTDAILPSIHQVYGDPFNTPDMGVHDYLIYGLNHYVSVQRQLYHTVIPLAYPTALMLDAAAAQLVQSDQAQTYSQSTFPDGGVFSYLSRTDRIRTLAALENLNLDLYLLPPPFQNNAGLIKYITDALNRLSLFGYYSEWPAYGTTRLCPPDDRHLEFFPVIWQQVGYPGVSLGYRDFRGFLLTMKEVEE